MYKPHDEYSQFCNGTYIESQTSYKVNEIGFEDYTL